MFSSFVGSAFGSKGSATARTAWIAIAARRLRRRNEPAADPVTGQPWSSRSLLACIDQGAARFGCSARDHPAGAMRDGDWLVGYGFASASYLTNIAAAAARVLMRPDGRARVRMAAHEIGNGAYTVLAITAAGRLGLSLE